MLEIMIALMFLSLIGSLGLAVYARGRKYEETKRLEDVTACREDDLSWSLKHTTVAYGARDGLGTE